jgi:uncharacterized protein YciI
MQFIIRAQDHKDSLERRMAVRQAHVDLLDKLKAQGRMLYGVALLDEAGNMCGSTIICDFPSRADVDAYLKTEPYVTGGVWEKIDVTPCKVGPTFARK